MTESKQQSKVEGEPEETYTETELVGIIHLEKNEREIMIVTVQAKDGSKQVFLFSFNETEKGRLVASAGATNFNNNVKGMICALAKHQGFEPIKDRKKSGESLARCHHKYFQAL